MRYRHLFALAVLSVSTVTLEAVLEKDARAQSVRPGLIESAPGTESPLPNSAVTRGSANHFTPAVRGSEWFYVDSLDFRGHARPALGLTFDYVNKPSSTFPGGVKTPLVDSQLALHLGGSINLWDSLRLSLDAPLTVVNSGKVIAKNNFIGDIRTGLDIRLHGHTGDKLVLALGTQFWIPTGSRNESWLGSGDWRWGGRLMIAGDVGPIAYGAGMQFNYLHGDQSGYTMGLNAAIGVKLLDKKLLIGPEYFMYTQLANKTSATDDGAFRQGLINPIELLLGAHYTVPLDLRFGGGVGFGLNQGITSPDFRVLFNIEWAPKYVAPPPPDKDGDGVADKDDACPEAAGVASEDPKKNGCPAPVEVGDADGDGIKDDVDACKDKAGVKSDDPKKNGCPADQDGDGIEDKDDACVDKPGVKSDDPKKNGCPEPGDTDGDGIKDDQDACVDKPGVKSDDPKKNGCPDPDRDGDGIPNDTDACPDAAGPADEKDPKRNGCPAASFEKGTIKILDQIKFATGSAKIVEDKVNLKTLEGVLKVLNEHKEVKFLRVEGHTDNKGAKAGNQKLSQERAQSVVNWIVKNGGKDANGFRAKGFGQDKPIETNDTDVGRASNRRVEFHMMTEEEVKAFDAANKK
jgi:OmpA-OmpF porin, OOP family